MPETDPQATVPSEDELDLIAVKLSPTYNDAGCLCIPSRSILRDVLRQIREHSASSF